MSRLAALLGHPTAEDVERMKLKHEAKKARRIRKLKRKVQNLSTRMDQIVDAASKDAVDEFNAKEGWRPQGEYGLPLDPDSFEVWETAYRAVFTADLFHRCNELLEEIEPGWKYPYSKSTYGADTQSYVSHVHETVQQWGQDDTNEEEEERDDEDEEEENEEE
jgi:hypothetical protein